MLSDMRSGALVCNAVWRNDIEADAGDNRKFKLRLLRANIRKRVLPIGLCQITRLICTPLVSPQARCSASIADANRREPRLLKLHRIRRYDREKTHRQIQWNAVESRWRAEYQR